MPPKTVRERIRQVENILQRAMATLDHLGVDAVTQQRGQILFDREDIKRSLEFQYLLKRRFENDLRILDPEFDSRSMNSSDH